MREERFYSPYLDLVDTRDRKMTAVYFTIVRRDTRQNIAVTVHLSLHLAPDHVI